ncbi:MAG: peptidylprolyl isomerase [Desulfovibrio sp.]|nr:peptidylprolyl isomerase [Desulfovibrio sp.]
MDMSFLRILPGLLGLLILAPPALAAPGDVAEVNGRGISFVDLEAARVGLFAGLSPDASEPDEAVLQMQYRHALSRLIEEALVCLYMEKEGMGLAPGALEAEEARIRADYPEGAFEETVLSLGIDLEDWRGRLERRLLVEQFATRVLRQEVSISAGEAQEYYRTHADEFTVPELWHFLRVTGQDGRTVAAACADILSGQEAAEVRKRHLVTIHDINIGIGLLAPDAAEILTSLKPGQASKVEKMEGGYRSVVLLRKTPPSLLEPAEISRRIEQALFEEKMPGVYADWLRRQLKKAKVRVNPAIFADQRPPLSGTEEKPDGKEEQSRQDAQSFR